MEELSVGCVKIPTFPFPQNFLFYWERLPGFFLNDKRFRWAIVCSHFLANFIVSTSKQSLQLLPRKKTGSKPKNRHTWKKLSCNWKAGCYVDCRVLTPPPTQKTQTGVNLNDDLICSVGKIQRKKRQQSIYLIVSGLREIWEKRRPVVFQFIQGAHCSLGNEKKSKEVLTNFSNLNSPTSLLLVGNIVAKK